MGTTAHSMVAARSRSIPDGVLHARIRVDVPLLAFVSLIGPLWIAPLFNRFGPMQDKVLEARILKLAERAGIEQVRVFEVDKSRVTKTINAYVTGIGRSKRIVLWDTAIAQQEPREVLAEMGHEMGHYVLGHVVKGILVQSLLLLAVLYMVSLSATAMIRRLRHRFAFDRVEDIASVPLMLLLINLFFFVIAPAWMAFSRHQEHEADRFALELTHDNHALGTHLVKLQERNLSIPRPGWFPEWWRATHPSLGDRIDFANAYKPWASGRPTVYGHLFK